MSPQTRANTGNTLVSKTAGFKAGKLVRELGIATVPAAILKRKVSMALTSSKRQEVIGWRSEMKVLVLLFLTCNQLHVCLGTAFCHGTKCNIIIYSAVPQPTLRAIGASPAPRLCHVAFPLGATRTLGATACGAQCHVVTIKC